MGSCVSRDRAPNTDGFPPEESTVYLKECELNLHNVDFETFQGAIKRFGYKIDLNDEHMKKIAPEIRLNVQEMQQMPSSVFQVVYKDKKMFFQESRHNVAYKELVFKLNRVENRGLFTIDVGQPQWIHYNLGSTQHIKTL